MKKNSICSDPDRILITGGAGLVGSEIPEDFGVKPPRRVLDLMDYPSLHEFMRENRIEEVVHLAAHVGGVKANSERMLDFFSINLTMNANVIRACAEFRVRSATFVLSTCVFPEAGPYPLVEENLHGGEPHHTNYGYAYAKRMLEVGARTLAREGIAARCVIPCNIYGPRDNYSLELGHVVPSLIHRCYLARRDGLPFTVWGSGRPLRQFVHSRDVARAIMALHVRGGTETTIFANPEENSISEVASIVAESYGMTEDSISYSPDMPEGIFRKPSSPARFMRMFPQFKFTPLRQGIAECCKHFEENHEHSRR